MGYSSGTSQIWSSPVPYLFGGLGLMLALIATALILLVCTHKKPSDEEKPQSHPKPAIEPLDMEPRLVVIMAGETNPTFIAMPLPSSYS